ncbi:hypothetical protein QAD02_017934 [Eretmocerus hayati]|uniref:Uncharacterized protein n=1 Tax=Eretmocerus hayati TaxID=131215 RepID=A0ACC2PFA0_9HYME|nr:hypothetical protein QAD02_017934 [Eretmocerus hayati]
MDGWQGQWEPRPGCRSTEPALIRPRSEQMHLQQCNLRSAESLRSVDSMRSFDSVLQRPHCPQNTPHHHHYNSDFEDGPHQGLNSHQSRSVESIRSIHEQQQQAPMLTSSGSMHSLRFGGPHHHQHHNCCPPGPHEHCGSRPPVLAHPCSATPDHQQQHVLHTHCPALQRQLMGHSCFGPGRPMPLDSVIFGPLHQPLPPPPMPLQPINDSRLSCPVHSPFRFDANGGGFFGHTHHQVRTKKGSWKF